MTQEQIWLIVGFIGQTIFASRFLIQWVVSERASKSIIPNIFWWISLAGSLILLSYAVHKVDPVFIVGQSCGFLVYSRNIYLIRNSIIEHLGSSSSDNLLSKELEYCRNWHWMWSKYYYNKKHYGHSVALTSISLNFFSGIFKYLIYLLIFNDYKKKIYKMRMSGIFNSVIGKNSWYRPKV